MTQNNPKPSRQTRRVNRVASRDLFGAALRRIYDRGQTRISAQCLANEMWPEARHDNANGQSFNLASGIAGRMLRKYRLCHEVENRVWEIIPEFLPNAKVRDSEIIGYNDRVILDQYGASIGGGDGSRSSRPTGSGSVTLTYDDLARILEEVKQDHCGAPGEPPAAYNLLDEAEMEIADETANWFLDAYIVRLLNWAYDQDLRPNAEVRHGGPDDTE